MLLDIFCKGYDAITNTGERDSDAISQWNDSIRFASCLRKQHSALLRRSTFSLTEVNSLGLMEFLGRVSMLESAAADGQLDITGFPAAEYKYFDTVRILGEWNRQGKLSTEAFNLQLKEARASYIQERIIPDSSVYKKYQSAIKRSDELRCIINNTVDADEVLRLSLECIELLTREEGFKMRSLRRLDKFQN